ncbi:MAG: sugar nucleotide-binding protein [Methylotenera sp.]|nr:sugar nucleotide-binding protein [Methylotenera sp.]
MENTEINTTNIKVLVLGGNGFIGRNIVAKLRLQGTQILIGSRKATQGNIVNVRMQHMKKPEDWLSLLQDVNVVVNSVGILRERRGETYNDIHTNSPAALANACAQLNVRLIHVSALGLSLNAKSNFIRSKFNGEQAILASGAQATIVRASLLDGEGGFGAKWFRRVASWPLQLVMTSQGLIAPLQVTDLGEAIANLCMTQQKNMPQIIELGGTKVMSIPQYLAQLRAAKKLKPALQLPMPKWLVRAASHVFDVLALTPLSFGHFELMQGYNVPAVNLLPALLKRLPTELGVTTPINNVVVNCLKPSLI